MSDLVPFSPRPPTRQSLNSAVDLHAAHAALDTRIRAGAESAHPLAVLAFVLALVALMAPTALALQISGVMLLTLGGPLLMRWRHKRVHARAYRIHAQPTARLGTWTLRVSGPKHGLPPRLLQATLFAAGDLDAPTTTLTLRADAQGWLGELSFPGTSSETGVWAIGLEGLAGELITWDVHDLVAQPIAAFARGPAGPRPPERPPWRVARWKARACLACGMPWHAFGTDAAAGGYCLTCGVVHVTGPAADDVRAALWNVTPDDVEPSRALITPNIAGPACTACGQNTAPVPHDACTAHLCPGCGAVQLGPGSHAILQARGVVV